MPAPTLITPPVRVGAIYENPNYYGRHVRGMCISSRKSHGGKWEGLLYIHGFGDVVLAENDPSMTGWAMIAEAPRLLDEPVEVVHEGGDAALTPQQVEINRLRRELDKAQRAADKAGANATRDLTV